MRVMWQQANCERKKEKKEGPQMLGCVPLTVVIGAGIDDTPCWSRSSTKSRNKLKIDAGRKTSITMCHMLVCGYRRHSNTIIDRSTDLMSHKWDKLEANAFKIVYLSLPAVRVSNYWTWGMQTRTQPALVSFIRLYSGIDLYDIRFFYHLIRTLRCTWVWLVCWD